MPAPADRHPACCACTCCACTPTTGAPLQLDDRALSVLEVLEGSLGGVEGSLLAALDRTVTGPGRRRLRAWLCR
jgi:DNA mismatch repair ATPase MutS